MRVTRAGYTRILPAAAILGMRRALELFCGSMDITTVPDRPDMLANIEEITDLIYCSLVDRREAECLLPKEMERKDANGQHSLIVRS